MLSGKFHRSPFGKKRYKIKLKNPLLALATEETDKAVPLLPRLFEEFIIVALIVLVFCF
jgi:hypothetical protein